MRDESKERVREKSTSWPSIMNASQSSLSWWIISHEVQACPFSFLFSLAWPHAVGRSQLRERDERNRFAEGQAQPLSSSFFFLFSVPNPEWAKRKKLSLSGFGQKEKRIREELDERRHNHKELMRGAHAVTSVTGLFLFSLIYCMGQWLSDSE